MIFLFSTTMFFPTPMAVEVWKLLGVYDIIKRVCQVDLSGAVVLEYVLCLPDHDIQVLGLPKLRETLATMPWYLWYERMKLIHGKETQSASQISLVVGRLAANYIILHVSQRPRFGLMDG